jgi:hypothetical protein
LAARLSPALNSPSGVSSATWSQAQSTFHEVARPEILDPGHTEGEHFEGASWASIAPAQALAAWFGARLAQRIAADNLSRIIAVALLGTGAVMLYSSVISG